MSKNYKINGNIILQEKETYSLKSSTKLIENKYKAITLWGLFLTIFILLIVCLVIFSYISIIFNNVKNFSITETHSLILLLAISITTIFISTIIGISINNRNKLTLINKIINNQEIYNINDTTTNYDDKQNIKSITSSDQKAKVLIAAIEAIKDL